MPERKARLGGVAPGAAPPRRKVIDANANNFDRYSWRFQSSYPGPDSPEPSPAVHCVAARSSAFRLTSNSPLAGLRHLRLRGGRVPLFQTLTSYCATFDILRLLTRDGEATEYMLARKLPQTQKAIAKSIHCLEWLGMIEHLPSGTRSRPLRLTELGKELLAKPLDAWPQWLAISTSSRVVNGGVAGERTLNSGARRSNTS